MSNIKEIKTEKSEVCQSFQDAYNKIYADDLEGFVIIGWYGEEYEAKYIAGKKKPSIIPNFVKSILEMLVKRDSRR